MLWQLSKNISDSKGVGVSLHYVPHLFVQVDVYLWNYSWFASWGLK